MEGSGPDGLLLVDKPSGCTSHDVVAQVRRALATRTVGHAGTLDPMATGLLVLLVGEATKLSSYLTAESKRYRATVSFGVATDSLDADGEVTDRRPGPPPEAVAVERTLAAMVGPMKQVPPQVSAIKREGVPAYRSARRGEPVDLAPRDVVLEHARVTRVEGAESEVEITCSKGFYVRALARDLAERLGTVAHLAALRRLRSGPFDVSEAIDGAHVQRAARGDGAARTELLAALRPLRAAVGSLRVVEVDRDTASMLACGKKPAYEGPPGTAVIFDPGGAAVCIAESTGGTLRVLRGFRYPTPAVIRT